MLIILVFCPIQTSIDPVEPLQVKTEDTQRYLLCFHSMLDDKNKWKIAGLVEVHDSRVFVEIQNEERAEWSIKMHFFEKMWLEVMYGYLFFIFHFFLVNSCVVWVAGALTAYLSLWTLAYLFWNISVNLVSHCCASLCGKTAVIDRYHAWIRHSLTVLATVPFRFPPSKMLLAVLWNTQWPFQSLSITGNQLTYCTQSSYFLLLTFTPSSRFCLSGNCWGDSSFAN